MDTICDRLKFERLRLGLSQEEMAKIGGVARNAQINYEKGERSPDINYLAGVAAEGVDVNYVITGKRASVAADDLAFDLSELVEAYTQLNKTDKEFVWRTVLNLTATKNY